LCAANSGWRKPGSAEKWQVRIRARQTSLNLHSRRYWPTAPNLKLMKKAEDRLLTRREKIRRAAP